MDKSQALQTFWSGFGLPAYDELSVPDDATLPYITYSVATDSFDNVVGLTGSLWYRSDSWAEISRKADVISEHIGEGGSLIRLDSGYLWVTKGTPFAQRMSDPSDDKIRRIYVSLMAEYLSAN